MKRYIYLLAGVAFLFCKIIVAQDPTFSQFEANALYYNPAYTGANSCLKTSVTYRSLWLNVPSRRASTGPLSTINASIDMVIRGGDKYKGGLGLIVVNDMEGSGSLTTTNIGISYAQDFLQLRKMRNEKPRLNLFVGFRAYYGLVRVNWDKFVFSDQLDYNVGILPSGSAIGQSGNASRSFWDLDFGVLLRNNFLGQNKWFNEVGFAMAHVVTPSISLTGSNTSTTILPRKYIGHYRGAIALANRIYLGPTILFEYQNNFTSLLTGIDFYVKKRNSDLTTPFIAGVYHRTGVMPKQVQKIDTRAVILYLGHQGLLGDNRNIITYQIGFSADMTYGGLNMSTYGAYELNVSFGFPTKMCSGNKDQKCWLN